MKVHRRGSMLIEVCSSLAAGSMIMLLGVVLIERTMHWSQAMQHQANLQRELSLLAKAWRDDFLRAEKVDARSPQLLVLTLPGKEVIYESLDHEVVRRTKSTNNSDAKPIASESYVLGDGYQATFDASFLVIRALNPAGEQVSTRLRVLGSTARRQYRIIDMDDQATAISDEGTLEITTTEASEERKP